jgi:hypothetical protein
MAFDVFEKEGWATGRYFGVGSTGFRDAVGDFGDFKQG